MKPETLQFLSKLMLLVIGSFFLPVVSGAVSITSTSGGGNWSSPATWQGGVVPDNSDTVIIQTGTVVMDVHDTIAVLIMQSGGLSLGEKLYVSGSFIFYAGSIFGIDTILIGGYANFLGAGTKKIGNKITLLGGGRWEEGKLDFTLDIDGINVAAMSSGGSLNIIGDTLKIIHTNPLLYKTNIPDGFFGTNNAVIQNISLSTLKNEGIGLGIGGDNTLVVAKHDLGDGGGAGPLPQHCENGDKDPGEEGIDCGGTCPNNCPSQEPDEEETDDDSDTDGLQTGLELYNPGGYLTSAGTSCATNETSGEGGITDTINFKIFIGEGAKMAFNSSVYFASSAEVRGFGTLKINNSILEINNGALDSNFTVRKLILNDGTVLKGNGNIKSRTVHSLKSTIKSNVNLEVTRLALDNSFLVGNGLAVADSQLILKGTLGNTIDRTIDVKWNGKWQCPDISFAVKGKINVDTNATLHVKMLSSEIRFRNGKGPVVDNKGLVNYIGTALGKLATPTNGSYFWNNGVQAVGRIKIPDVDPTDENTGGGSGGPGGGDPADGEGDVEPGNSGDAACDNTPVDPPVQSGCFKLAKGKIRTRKGAAVYNSCFDQITTGGIVAAGSAAVTTGPLANSTDLNISLFENASLTSNSCLNSKVIRLSGNTTYNINADCSALNITMTGNSALGGNGDLNIIGNISLNSGTILGNRNINVGGNVINEYGTIKNQGNLNITGQLIAKGGFFGDGIVTGSVTVADSCIIDFNPVTFRKKTINLNGFTRWTSSNISLIDSAVINIGLGAIFNPTGNPAPFNGRSIVTSNTGFVNNYGTFKKDYTSNSSIATHFNNYGTIEIDTSILSFQKLTNFENASVTHISSGGTLDFTAGTGHFILTGSQVTGGGSIRLNSATLNIESGAIISSNLSMNNVSGNISSAQNLTFKEISYASGNWSGNHHITTSGNFTISGGTVKNQGNLNIIGKLIAKGGFFGDGVVTGIITVSDSFIVDLNPVTFRKKVIDLNGHTKWSSSNISLDDNAILNIGSGTIFNPTGNPAPFNGRSIVTSNTGFVNNYGTIKKDYTSSSSITAQFNNYGTIEIDTSILSFNKLTFFRNGSNTHISPGGTLDFTSGPNHFVEEGGQISGEGSIRLNSATLDIESGAVTSSDLSLNNVSGNIVSAQDLTFKGVVFGSGNWSGNHHITTLGNFTMSGGVIKNQGNLNIVGKLIARGGSFGDGTATGIVTVADSCTIDLNPVTFNNKTVNLKGNVNLSAQLIFTNNAALNIDSYSTFEILSTFANISNITGTNTINNYGILKKKTPVSSTFNISVNFINRGIITGNGSITFNQQLTNRCIVAPGLSPGLLKFNKFSNDSSFLHMELGYDQTMAFAKDSFVVTALPASLGGELDVMLTGGFIPDSGAVYRMITLPSGYTGTFNEVQTMGMPNDSFNWITIYNPTNVEIKYCPVWYKDEDGDGHGDFDNPEKYTACTVQPMGFVRSYDDCDDGDNLEFPGQVWYFDNDGDGYGGDDDGSCTRFVGGFHSTELIGVGDCDDGNASVYPGAPEICDGVDNNCNNLLENDDPSQTHLIVVSTGNGPGSLPYLFNNCPIVDTIYFDSVIEGDTIHYGANGLLFTNSTFLVNPEANPVTIAFDQSVVDDPIVVQGSSTEVLFKGLNFIFSNNAGKCGITTAFSNNKVFLDDVDIQTEDVFELCGPGEIEVKTGVKIRY